MSFTLAKQTYEKKRKKKRIQIKTFFIYILYNKQGTISKHRMEARWTMYDDIKTLTSRV